MVDREITLADVATLARDATVEVVRGWAAAGQLRVIRTAGSRLFFSERDVVAFLRARSAARAKMMRVARLHRSMAVTPRHLDKYDARHGHHYRQSGRAESGEVPNSAATSGESKSG